LHEKRLYLSPELASPFEKSGGVALRVNLWIPGVYIKPLIGHGKLGGGIVNAVFGDLFWPALPVRDRTQTDRFGWGPGLNLP
jgi:hypothetical protein